MYKNLTKIVSVGLIFVAPLVIIFRRYNADQIVSTNSRLGLVPLMFIVTITLVALWFASNQFMHMVRTDKFGYLSIGFFGAMLSILLFLVWFVLQYIVTSAKINLDLFVETFSYHQRSLIEMLVFIISGLTIAFIGRLYFGNK
jgi:hypothetical protein